MNSENTPKFLIEEQQIITVAQGFVYPVTPDVARGVRARLAERARPRRTPSPRLRRVVAVAAALLLVLAGLLAVPQVRAAILEWLQVGAIRIFVVEPTPAPLEPLRTPIATPKLSGLGEQMTWAEVRETVPFPVRLPSRLGPPEAVYLRQAYEPMVVSLVWFDAAAPEQIHAMLWQINAANFATKWVYVDQMQELTVNEQPAFGLTGPHTLQLLEETAHPPRLVTNTVLIWQSNGITYRLEGEFTLEEAVQIAESLQ